MRNVRLMDWPIRHLAGFVLVVCWSGTARAQVPVMEEWAARGGEGQQSAYAVVVDLSGAIFTAVTDCSVLKHDVNGDLLWAADPAGNAPCSPVGLALDATGDVLVGGLDLTPAVPPALQNGDYFAARLDPVTGDTLWATTYDHEGKTLYDIARSMVVDANGNVYMVGNHRRAYGTDLDDYLTVKFDGATGEVLWTRQKHRHWVDWVSHVALGPDGNLYLTGTAWLSVQPNFLTVSYAPDGTERWAHEWGDGSDSETPGDIAFAPNGELLVSGYDTAGGSSDTVVLAYDAETGLPTEVLRHTPAADESLHSVRLLVAGDGSFYLAGSGRTSTSIDDLKVLKFDAAATPLWSTVYDTPENGNEWAGPSDFSHDGNVIMAATAYTPSTYRDVLVLKLDSATGDPIWVARWDSGNRGNDSARALAIDPGTGDTFVAGRGSFHALLLKYPEPPILVPIPVPVAGVTPVGEGIRIVHAESWVTRHAVTSRILEDGEEVLSLEDGQEGTFVASTAHSYAVSHTFQKTEGSDATAQAFLRLRAEGGVNHVTHREAFDPPPDIQERTVLIDGDILNLSYPANPRTWTFDGLASFDPDGWIVQHRWEVFDGTGALVDSLSGDIAVYTFPRQDTYTVRLTVEDNDGFTASADTVVSL